MPVKAKARVKVPIAVCGSIIAQRVKSTNTTAELRKQNFAVVIAPAIDGSASGSLYLDDGVSVTQATTTTVSFAYKGGKLTVQGHFGHPTGVNVARVRIAGVTSAPREARLNGKAVGGDRVAFDASVGVVDVSLGIPFKAGFTLELH